MEIAVYHKGEVAAWTQVDDHTYEWLNRYRWVLKVSRGVPYVRRSIRLPGVKDSYYISMHREILGLPIKTDGREADHINHDTMDNRMANLRIVDHAGQMRNRVRFQDAVSKYRGVWWHKPSQKWRAGAYLNKKQYSLGTFSTEDAAAEAVRKWRDEHVAGDCWYEDQKPRSGLPTGASDGDPH